MSMSFDSAVYTYITVALSNIYFEKEINHIKVILVVISKKEITTLSYILNYNKN